jgi:ABC-2 type transport system permease protein
MTFRSNFVIEAVSSVSWVCMNLGFYVLIFNYAPQIGSGTGWGKFEFFVFLATAMFVNSIVQAFFMPNAQRLSEMIRTGGLDFALLKPIDTQFLISLERVSWSQLGNFVVACGLLVFSLWQLTTRAENPLQLSPVSLVLYPLYILCGVAIMYSLMIALAATSIWLGRNQHLYNFWFYITNFSRYPMEIYNVSWGVPLLYFFTFAVPILVVINVPARLLAQPLSPRAYWEWPLAGFALIATVTSLTLSRWIFTRALASYRSASS